MERKKDNVIALAWRHVVCPAAKAADPISWILFIVFLVVFCGGVIFRVSSASDGGMHTFYMEHYAVFWYGAWAIFVLATLGPIFNLKMQLNEVPIVVLVGFGVFDLLIFIVISAFALTQDSSIGTVTALTAATATAGMVGIGWIVQQQTAARATRRAHTFNILMQSRLSAEFQKQVAARGKYFPSNTKITEEDARLHSKEGLRKKIEELDGEFKTQSSRTVPEAVEALKIDFEEKKRVAGEKHESLKSVVYLLNFYEFICAGILLRELDERMIKETLLDIAVGLYKDAANLRELARQRQPDVFCNLDRLIGASWAKKC